MANRQKAEPSAAAWLRERSGALAQKIVDQHFCQDRSFAKQYGAVGRVRCLEDATFHLCFLAEAAEADNEAHFVDYVRWAKPMLASRHIDWRHLRTNLEIMCSVILRSRPPQPVKEFAGPTINAALEVLPSASEEIPSLIDASNPDHKVANEYLRTLLSNDREKAYGIVRDYVKGQNSIRSVFANVFGVAQREIGRLWQLNLISVAQEHYCTAATEVIMARISERLVGRPRSRKTKVVAFCPPNEEHCVGLQMICELLELEGWPTHFIGARVPLSSAVSFITGMKPGFVLISASTAMRISELKLLIQTLSRALPAAKIIVGGRLFDNDAELPAKLGAHGVGKNPNEAINLLERLSG
jgi:MerR family transcriptional regulator, light-induced transcriptional regulator